MHRLQQPPGAPGVPLPPPRLSPVMLHSKIPPDPEIPLVMGVVQQRRAGKDRRTREQLPPHPGSADTATRHRPETLRQGVPLSPHPLPLCSAAKLPGEAFTTARLTLRPQPPLCHDAAADTELEFLELQELYQELGQELFTKGLCFPPDPLVEPAAAAADLPPLGSQNAGTEPALGQQHQSLFTDYLQFVAASGSDFLGTIFHLDTGKKEPVPALELHQEPPAPALEPRQEPPAPALEPRQEPPAPALEPHQEPPLAPSLYQQGLWQPVILAPVPKGLQHRLHWLWAVLSVPAWDRLAMAVKYGTGGAWLQLPAALELWEAAASAILHREHLLAQLEQVQDGGSDPSQLLQPRAGSARGRQGLLAAVSGVEAQLQVTLRQLQEQFGDVVTLHGQPCPPQGRRDPLEMLYQLQQHQKVAELREVLGGPPPNPPRTPQPSPAPQ